MMVKYKCFKTQCPVCGNSGSLQLFLNNSGKFLKPCKIVLASGMLLNPIPIESYGLITYFFFSIIAVPAVIFITSTALSLKYPSYRKPIGIALVGLGLLELLPFIFFTFLALLTTPITILALLGLTTLAGGATILKQTKHHWMFLPIIAAITLTIWAFEFFFIN